MEPTLIIDADSEVCRQMVTVLTSLGEQTVCKQNGKAALAYLKKHVPRLIIADAILLDMKGITLLEVIRKDPRQVAVPIILLSNNPGYADEARSKGAAEYWIKSDMLYSNLRQLLGHYLIRSTVSQARPAAVHRNFARERRKEKLN